MAPPMPQRIPTGEVAAVVERLAVGQLGVASIGLPLGGCSNHHGDVPTGSTHPRFLLVNVDGAQFVTLVRHREEGRPSQPPPRADIGSRRCYAARQVCRLFGFMAIAYTVRQSFQPVETGPYPPWSRFNAAGV